MDYNEFEVDLSLYRLFLIVCQNGSFSKTADLLGMTQPTISYNMKKLEDCLGVKLFERGNNLSLTPEAETLIPYVEAAMSSLKKGEDKVIDLINLKRGQIAIGVPSHIGVFLLSDIIENFNKNYPNIKIKVICKPTKELFRLIRLNELDIVIDCSPLDAAIGNDLEIIKISTETCCLACNKKRKELLNKKIRFKDITKYPLIVPLVSSGSTKKLIEIFNENKVEFDPLFEITTSDMIAEMVSKNLGIGYLFEKTIDKYEELEKIDLDILLPKFDIFMIYKDYLLSSATKKFITFLNKK